MLLLVCAQRQVSDAIVYRAAANTRIGVKRIRTVRVRGGHQKYRALRLDHGTFSWGSEGVSSLRLSSLLQCSEGDTVQYFPS